MSFLNFSVGPRKEQRQAGRGRGSVLQSQAHPGCPGGHARVCSALREPGRSRTTHLLGGGLVLNPLCGYERSTKSGRNRNQTALKACCLDSLWGKRDGGGVSRGEAGALGGGCHDALPIHTGTRGEHGLLCKPNTGKQPEMRARESQRPNLKCFEASSETLRARRCLCGS